MPKQRIPLIGSPIFRNQDVYDYVSLNAYRIDQFFLNCFPETARNPITGKGKAFLNKRVGFEKTVVAPASFQGTTAGLIWSGYSGGAKGALAFTDATNTRVYDSSGSIIGAAFVGPNAGQWLSETVITGTSNLVFTGRLTSSGEWQAWYYAEGGAWTQITDVDYPGRPVGVGGLGLALTNGSVHMDGYMFVLTRSGLIYNSDLNSLANWTSTSFIAAQFSPDLGVGLNKIKNYLVAFGEGSVEFFARNDSAVGSPVTRVSGSALRIGAYVSNTDFPASQSAGDAIYFIGKNLDNGAVGAYRTTGPGSLQKISTNSIDKWFSDYVAASVQVYVSGSFVMLGMQHIVFTNFSASSEGQHAIYCVDTNTWWFMTFVPFMKPLIMMGFNGKNFFTTLNVSGGEQGRNIYTTIPHLPVYQDDGSNYTMSITTGDLDLGTDNLKEFTGFTLIADKQTTAGTVSVSYSNNNGASFSTPKTIDMTVQQKKLAAGLGWGRRRSWKITETVNRPFRAEAIDIEWEVSEE